MVEPRYGDTDFQYTGRRKCSNCGKRGEWKILSEEEAKLD
jgi:hypothetical protein